MNLIKYKDIEKSLIKALYEDRENYTIIALTGYIGTGCSTLASLMEQDFKDWDNIRKPIPFEISAPSTCNNEELFCSKDLDNKNNHKIIASTIFARKYKVCYDFVKSHYKPFFRIKYSSVLLFLVLEFIIRTKISGNKNLKNEEKEKIILNDLNIVLRNLYKPGKEDDKDDKDFIKKELLEQTQNLEYFKFKDWNNLINTIANVGYLFDNHHSKVTVVNNIGKLFFDKNNPFKIFSEELINYLYKYNPYLTAFFFHRLGYVVRATGNPLKTSEFVYDSKNLFSGDYLYIVVATINQIIKDIKKINEKKSKIDKTFIPTRIVIDKIRNSLEAKYLKERYSAFYFIGIHSAGDIKSLIRKRIYKLYDKEEEIKDSKEFIEWQIDKLLKLDSEERKGKDFEKGKFYAPNTSQCLADAEIHMSNEEEFGGNKPFFFSMSEQWLKYAALIQHPGLITPSSEERCMVVAYTAKFNSGCLSRQVGAVITNQAHTIRSIGWNDVPYGQIPCSLREFNQLMDLDGYPLKIVKYIYSDYESKEYKKLPDNLSFIDHVKLKYKNLHKFVLPYNKNILSNLYEGNLMKGIPDAYCFKTLQNEFEGEKNQVHTRSLHAEENAILQMAKYGGEALQNGIIYVTASPCELCCKKLYQIGVRKIVYIDEYPGISRENIIANGFHRPKLKQFQGAYGTSYFKLYQPLISLKDELAIRRTYDNIPTMKKLKYSDFKNKLSEIFNDQNDFSILKDEEKENLTKELETIIEKLKVRKE